MRDIDNEDALEELIHQAFHTIADELDMDVDLVANIIERYNEIVSTQIERKVIISEN